MEKKGEYENPGFEFLKSASEREIFYLHRGLTISGARELLVQIINIDEKSLNYYTNDSSNELFKWFKNMIKDQTLTYSIKDKKTKKEIYKIVLERLGALQEIKLKKFGINIQKNNLLIAENYIMTNLSKGVPYQVIRNELITNGWSAKVVDLILESDTYYYRNYTSIHNLFEVNAAYEKFEGLKKKIIIGIAEGLILKDVLDYLKNLGWPNQILNYVLTTIYKPNKDMTKLYWYIIKEIGDNKKDLLEVKSHIIKAGWNGYIVDNLIYRFNTFDNDLDLLLSYLTSFDSQEKIRIKDFLIAQGWDEDLIDRAIDKRELKKFWEQISKSLSLENENSLRFNTEIFNKNILQLKNTSGAIDFWKEILRGYKKIGITEFIEDDDELHLDKEYIYYYSKDEIKNLIESTKKGFLNNLLRNTGMNFYYSSPLKPLLCDFNKVKFLIAPHVIKKECVSCKIKFPIIKMTKIEMWDTSRTHKITRYVCKQHENMITTLMDENKFVQ